MQEDPHYWFAKPYADFVQRLRVPSGFLLLVAFAWFSQPSITSLIAGLPVAVLGLFIRAWAAGHLQKNQALSTAGPYAYVRNPLYVGTLLSAAGIILAGRSVVLALLSCFVFLLVYLPAIELEEQHLRKLFPAYGAYAAGVHRFLPLSKCDAGETAFSWRLYLRNQEYKALLGFLLALAWLLKRWLGTVLR